MKKITEKCIHCGHEMFPRMRFDCIFGTTPQFYLYCSKCKATSPSTAFEPAIIDVPNLVNSINETLSYTFELDEMEDE